jgi:ABC-2 type transport system ATP-binding protein
MKDPVIKVEKLTKVFGSFVAVDRVSFTVNRGEIFGFLGSNGAGKTTTIRMLCGLLPPSSGRAWILGLDVASQGKLLRPKLGYMSQRFSLYTDLTVEENMVFWGRAYGLEGTRLRERIAWGLQLADLAEQKGILLRQLPLGFRQRLALAVALLHEPAVVFLDEPTSGVDPEARREFWEVIDRLSQGGGPAAAHPPIRGLVPPGPPSRALAEPDARSPLAHPQDPPPQPPQRTTILVTTHALDEAERCHRVAFMHQGQLLALDSVAGLKSQLPEGRLFRLRTPQASLALEILEAHPQVEEVALFGSDLHLLLKASEATASLTQALAAAGATSCQWQPLRPSLEDAFIFLIRQSQRKENA